MEIFRKLHSILAPSSEPAVRSQPRQPRPGSSGQPNFAETLRAAAADDPSILPFGVQNDRLANHPNGGTGFDSGSTQTDATGTQGSGGPSVLPDAPEVDFPAEHPIDALQIEIGDSLESTIVIGRATFANEPTETGIAPPSSTHPTTPSSEAKPGAPVSKALQLPPIGVLWSALQLRASGASGPGIATTDEAVQGMLEVKFDQYSNAEKYGYTALSTEAKLFRDAVDRGYIENSPAGLGTLLSYLSMGSVVSGNDPIRPAALTNYFNHFFAAERAAAKGQ